ncbi:MAG: arylsulfatase [Pirellulales bacterium]
MISSKLRMLALLGASVTSVAVLRPAVGADQANSPARRPNIVFILADDLGYGDVGCFGQQKIRTPHIDRLATEGMRCTQYYSGHNVCAPSRCALMTGKHPGHGFIRDNRSVQPEGQQPVPPGELKLPLTLKALGYTIGGFGKWGLGPVGSTGDPLKQGFDRFYGYNCQAVAHNFYPVSLWDNDRRAPLNNPPFAAHQRLPADADPKAPASYERYAGQDYSADLIAEQARAFLQANKDRPFFLYFPTTVPHLSLQVPPDSLSEYLGKFDDEPYVGDRRYLPHIAPRAAYAAMVTRMDREVGSLVDLVEKLGLSDNTIFVFTSDNGPLYDRHGGTDCEFFNSAGGLRGRKGSFYEGGFRVPCIVRWKGHIAPGTTSERVSGAEDWLPTLLTLIGAADKVPAGIDGISFAPTLLGQPQEPRPFLYRESPGYGGQQSLRVGDWKIIRTNLNPPPRAENQKPGAFELYNLAEDPTETTDLAGTYPWVLDELVKIAAAEHTPSTLFPIRALDASR